MEQNCWSVRFMLALLALVVTLAMHGPSHAFTLRAGTVCYENTITEDTSDAALKGKTFPSTVTLFDISGPNVVINGTAQYPDTTATTYFSCTGQLIEKEVHTVCGGTLDESALTVKPFPYRLSGVWSFTTTCNADGVSCTGTWWGTYSAIDLKTLGIGVFYSAGTQEEVACK